MEQNEVLTLENVASGAARELFNICVQAIAQNIADPNTPAESKRSFTLKFTFLPFPNRTGALVEVNSESKTAAVASVKSNVYFEQHGNEVKVYGENPRQTRMFETPANPHTN